MKRRKGLKIIHIDAFTEEPYGGNPATVVFDADALMEDDFVKISREMNPRETVFVLRSGVADYRFRYFTPRGEIDFSGHSTIGAFQALVEEARAELVQDITMFTLETLMGVLEVEVVKNEAERIHEVQIAHMTPQFLDTFDPKEYAEALGLTLADIMSPNPVQVVNTGNPQVIVPLSTFRAMKRIRPDWDKLAELQEGAECLLITVFSREAREPTSDAHVRSFAPALGLYEDPISGTAAGGVGSYLIRYGIIEGMDPVSSIVIEQGHFLERPGKVFVEVRGHMDEIEMVKVSGKAVTVFEGTLYK